MHFFNVFFPKLVWGFFFHYILLKFRIFFPVFLIMNLAFFFRNFLVKFRFFSYFLTEMKVFFHNLLQKFAFFFSKTFAKICLFLIFWQNLWFFVFFGEIEFFLQSFDRNSPKKNFPNLLPKWELFFTIFCQNLFFFVNFRQKLCISFWQFFSEICDFSVFFWQKFLFFSRDPLIKFLFSAIF